MASNGIGQHEAHERLRAGNGLARGREDEVTFLHAGLGGRGVGNDLHDAETELLPRPFRQTRRERCRRPGDTEVGAAHATFGEKGGDDASSVVVDRNGKAQSHPGDRGVDTRPSPLTTRAVTLPASPSGLPTATTSCPTRKSDALPSLAGGGVAPSARTTARSESASVPMTRIGEVVPSAKAAVPELLRPTAWALVRRKPSSVKTTAEPALASTRPSRRRRDMWRAATRGVSSAAIRVTTWE
jgi:hypothetical protein